MKNIRKIVWGVFFIAAAVFLITLPLTGPFSELSVFSILICCAMAPVIIESAIRLNFTGVFFPLALAVFVLRRPLGFEDLSFWAIFGSALLLSIGFSMVFNPRGHHFLHFSSGKKHREAHDSKNHTSFLGSNANETITENEVSCKVSFGDSSKFVHSKALKNAEFCCSFGNLQVYFDDAVLDPAGADVKVECSFGNLELYVPRTWRVKDDIGVTLGNFDVHGNRGCADDAPVLRISGSVSLGNIELHAL